MANPPNPHAAEGMAAFDKLPDDVRNFMKYSRRSYKSLEVAKMVEATGEDLTLYRLRKIDRSHDNSGTKRQSLLPGSNPPNERSTL